MSSRFSVAQRTGILAEARANAAKREFGTPERTSESTRSSSRQFEIVHKTQVNDAAGSPPARAPSGRRTSVESVSDLNWWEWVDRRIDARLEAAAEGMGRVLGEFHDEALREVAAVKRELELLRQEFAVLRDQVGLERGLRDLREEVEQARSEVPGWPRTCPLYIE
jgi:hypothetical protein